MLRLTIALAVGSCRTEPFALRVAPGSPHPAGESPTDLELVDVDADSRLDVVAVSAKDGALHVLRGDGHGGLAASQRIDVGVTAHDVASADLDGDGLVDLVATQHDSHGVTVLLGDGRGGFRAPVGSPFAARTGGEAHNHGLVLADFDEDGRVDALTSDQDHDSVALLLGDGRGGFAIAPGSPWPVGRDPYPPTVADLDGDGHRDVVSPLVVDDGVGVLLGDGRGGFVAAAGAAAGSITSRPYRVAVGELTGDGRQDAIVTHDDATVATLLVGDGEGGLVPSSTLELGCRGYALAIADVDGDRRVDVLTTCAPESIAILLGDGRGGFVHGPGSPHAVGKGPTAVALGDLDRDGALDVVSANFDSNDVVVLLRAS